VVVIENCASQPPPQPSVFPFSMGAWKDTFRRTRPRDNPSEAWSADQPSKSILLCVTDPGYRPAVLVASTNQEPCRSNMTGIAVLELR
jgi:hypothetical protein